MEQLELTEKEKFLKYIEAKNIAADIPKEYLKYSFFGGENKIGYNFLDSNNQVNDSKKRALDITIDYIKNLKQNLSEGKSLFYFGQPNKKLGLSLLGIFILRAAIESRYSAKFAYFPTFCEDMCYGVDAESRDIYYEVDFLMLDSISSKSQANNKISDGFADVLLFRKKENKPTIFSSYIGIEELYGKYSESLISYFEDFVIKVELKHEEQCSNILYDMDKLLKYMKEKRNEKRQMSYAEIMSVFDKFVNSYQFH
jgi:hypothetical protein